MDCKALVYNDLSAEDTEWTNLIVARGVRIPTAFDEIFFRSVTFRDIEKKNEVIGEKPDGLWLIWKSTDYCCAASYSLNEKALRFYKG